MAASNTESTAQVEKTGDNLENDAAMDESGPNKGNDNALSGAEEKAPPTSGSSSTDDAQGQSKPEDGKPQEPEQVERTKLKTVLIMAALMMAVFLAALDVTIITTALPTISEEFNSASGYTWIGSAFLLANASSAPVWGKCSDIFGRKPVLLGANIVFFVGSLVAALANSIGMLIAARAVQGLGAGGLVILVNILIGDLFSLRNRGLYYAFIGMVWSFATSIGPIIGGAFTQGVTWRWCFYINLPLDGVAFIIIVFFLDVQTPKTPIVAGLKAIDWIGVLTVVGGTLMFLFGLEYGGVTYPWDSATVICLIVFGVVTWGLFIFWEARFALYPIMPLRLFRDFSNISILFLVAIHGIVFIAGSYYLPLYFQAIRGLGPLLSGVYLLPTAISLSISSIATGIFIRKTGLFLPPIYTGVFFLVLGYGLFVDFSATSSLAKIILYQGVAGFGVGPLFQAPLIAFQSRINPRDIATGTATFGFIRQLATSISVVIGQVVFQNRMSTYSSDFLAVLPAATANRLSGGSAGASTDIIAALDEPARSTVRTAFAQSLQKMWIMYVCFAALGVVASLGVRKKALSKQHQETKTGLEAERENKAERDAERAAKRASKAEKRASRAGGGGRKSGEGADVESGPAEEPAR
ncbi:hypothetical protein MBLNU230_g4936t1 [Neophaeotheca triangularis]